MDTQLTCEEHGLVLAERNRGNHKFGELSVKDVLVYVCPTCHRVLGFPHESSGRIALAQQEAERLTSGDFRVPVEIEDLALAVHARLGTLGLGETFTLPFHLGLHLAGGVERVNATWKRFDDCKVNVRARPRLTRRIERRLERLAKAWGAESSSDAFRWLVVAAWEAVAVGATRSSEIGSALYASPVVTRNLRLAAEGRPPQVTIVPANDDTPSAMPPQWRKRSA